MIFWWKCRNLRFCCRDFFFEKFVFFLRKHTISSLFSATSHSKSLIFMNKKARFVIFGFSPNLERTVLRDYWADSDVRTCYGYLLDLYFMKKIFFRKKYFFFIENFLFQNHAFLKNHDFFENFEKVVIFRKNHDFF